MNSLTETIKAVILGHAVGDALGVPVEFASREELDANPVTDMEGFGTYPYPAGCWSDDTSMTLCALESLSKGKLDFDDIMLNFGKWYYEDMFTPTGEMFDVGNTCSTAIENYSKNGMNISHCGLTSINSNGNGSLMRILPFALYLYNIDAPIEIKINIIHQASALTHANEISEIACGIYSFIIWQLLESPTKASVINGLRKARNYYRKYFCYGVFHERLFRRIGCIFRHFEDYDTFKPLSRDEIRSTGYVVDTLEAAVWCIRKNDNYKDCVLTAVNLGDDTDTVAAVAGGLAGALYGYDAIPKEWLEKLKRREYIEEMCEKASESWNKR